MKIRVEYHTPPPAEGSTSAAGVSTLTYTDIDLDGHAVPSVGDGFVLAGLGLTITARIWLADPNSLGVSAILKTTPLPGVTPG